MPSDNFRVDAKSNRVQRELHLSWETQDPVYLAKT